MYVDCCNCCCCWYCVVAGVVDYDVVIAGVVVDAGVVVVVGGAILLSLLLLMLVLMLLLVLILLLSYLFYQYFYYLFIFCEEYDSLVYHHFGQSYTSMSQFNCEDWILFSQTCQKYDLGRIRFYRATLFVKRYVSFSLILVYFDSTVWETILTINVRT